MLRRYPLTAAVRSRLGAASLLRLCAGALLLAAMASAQTPCASICLLSSTLPSATVNAPYSTALSTITTGGTPPYTYSSAVLPAGLEMSSAGLITGTPTQPNPGGVAGSVTITDHSNPPKTVTGIPLVIAVFAQPLTITTPALPLGVQGVAYSQTIQAVGGAPPYSWSLFRSSLTGTGLTLDGTTGNVKGTPAASGPISFRVQLTDQQQTQAFQTITLQIYPQLVISTAAALHFALTGQAYSVQLATQTGTGAPGTVTWSAAPGTVPPGLMLDPTGLLHGMPTGTGLYSFAIQASDGISPALLNATLNVYGPLSITTAQLPNGALQQSYGSVPLIASGGSGNFSWFISGLPSGLTQSNGIISGTPTASGPFPVGAFVSDLITGQSASQAYTLTIGYPALSINPPALTNIAAGGSVSVTLTTTGGLGPFTWSPLGTLPQGLTLTPGGLLSGTPAQPGNFAIAVQATDAETQPVSASATVNVNVLGFTNTSPLPPGTTTATYSATLNAVGGTGTYTFSASGLPTGLSLSTAGILSGPVKQPGTYTFSAQVTSGGVTASATYSVTINLAGPLSLTAPSLSNGTVNLPYSATLSAAAAGGTPPYQWSVQSGALPPGLSLSATGILSGTPATPVILTGQSTYTFGVEVTDTSGAIAFASATIQINPPALTITTQSPLASGIVNIPYAQQILTATGGVAPYTFFIAGGGLPSGLALSNGTIGGTPTAQGNFSITIAVEDSAGTEAQSTLAGNIRPASADLVLAAGALPFNLSAGGSTLPASQNVSVTSSDVMQKIPFSIQVTPGANWLSVSSGTTTPTALVVSLTSQALALAPSQTPYSANITLKCNATPCAGNTQTVSVTLAVTAGPGILNAVTQLLSFSTSSSPPAASSQPLTIQNTGGSPLSFASINCEAAWCMVGSVPMFLYPGASAPLNITADPTGLNPGFYRTTVDISSSGGFASVPVTFLIAQSSELLLAPSGAQMEMPAGGAPGNPNGSFLVSVAGSATVNWTAAVTSTGTNWLVLNSSGGTASGSAPGTVSFSIDPTMTAGLAPQAYYATIEVTAPNTINSPLDFQVILNVVPAANPSYPNPVPAGLVFLTQAGANPLPQIVQVFTSSATPIGYQASANTNDGAAWLSVSPPTGTTSASAVPESEVSIDSTSLSPGIYYGGVNYSFASASVRTVNVMLVVEPAAAGPSGEAAQSSVHANTTAPAACSPSALAPAQTGLVDNFSAPASWPTPLSILLLDDCGHTIPNGQVAVTFTNGDPPLALGLANRSTGLYSGTWTPGKVSAQVSLTARATAPGFSAASLRIAGQIVPNTAPVLKPGGTFNSFNPQPGDAMAPGTIVQINGTALASGTMQASTIPLPTNLNQTQILIGGVPAPLFYVSPNQIVAQVPLELNPSNQYQLIASANGALTSPISIQLAPVTPGFAVNPDGSLNAQHGDGSPVTATSPAQPGEEVVSYLLGLGNLATPIADGAGAPLNPLAVAAVMPVVTLNGTPATVVFAGLTPGLVGLYQVNFQVPPGTQDGNAMVALTQGAFTSNTAIMPVHQ